MKKLLRFKEFSEVLENLIFEAIEKSPWEKTKVDNLPYWESYKKNVASSDRDWPVGTKRDELIRAKFGLDDWNDPENISDIVISNINKMFSGVDPAEKVINITKFTPGNLSGELGSGKMVTYLVTTDKNPKGYYITNQSADKRIKIEGVEKSFPRAQLRPGKLGLNGEWTDKKQLSIDAMESVNDKFPNASQVNIKFIEKLLDICTNPEKYGFSAKKSNSVDEVEGTYRIENLNFDDFEEIKSTSLADIQNDFGEVLGSIFVFNLINNDAIGGGVKYPGANEALVDFWFNGKGISSKGGKGAAATITEYVKRIKDVIEDVQILKKHGWEPTDDERWVFNNILKKMLHGESGKESKNEIWFDRGTSSGVFVSVINMLESFPTRGWKTYKQSFGVDAPSSRDELLNSFDKCINNDTFYDAYKTYMNSVTFNPAKPLKPFVDIYSSKSQEESKAAWEQFKDLRNKNKNLYAYPRANLIGSILYPCSWQLVDQFRQTQLGGKSYEEIISDMVNRAVTISQLNLTISIDKDSITFTMHKSEKSRYVIHGLNSFGDSLNSNFKLKLKE